MILSAKLIAFDDEKDEAIVELENGKKFAFPSEYITTATNQKSAAMVKDFLCGADKNSIINKSIFWYCVETNCGLHYFL